MWVYLCRSGSVSPPLRSVSQIFGYQPAAIFFDPAATYFFIHIDFFDSAAIFSTRRRRHFTIVCDTLRAGAGLRVCGHEVCGRGLCGCADAGSCGCAGVWVVGLQACGRAPTEKVTQGCGCAGVRCAGIRGASVQAHAGLRGGCAGVRYAGAGCAGVRTQGAGVRVFGLWGCRRAGAHLQKR